MNEPQSTTIERLANMLDVVKTHSRTAADLQSDQEIHREAALDLLSATQKVMDRHDPEVKAIIATVEALGTTISAITLEEVVAGGYVVFEDDPATDKSLEDKLSDALTPGFQAEFDPDEAERAGAFQEDALSEEDAAESDIDLINATVPDTDAPTTDLR